jgi:hypothetical protein
MKEEVEMEVPSTEPEVESGIWNLEFREGTPSS